MYCIVVQFLLCIVLLHVERVPTMACWYRLLIPDGFGDCAAARLQKAFGACGVA